MTAVARALRGFISALALLQQGRIAVPILCYFAAKLLIIALYVVNPGGALSSFWALFAPRVNGEALAHYPTHLIMMPLILGRLDIVIEIFLLSLMQGATILLVASAHGGTPPRVSEGLSAAGKRYGSLVGASIVGAAAVLVVVNAPAAFLGALHLPRGFVPALGVIAGTVAQAFFLYAMPLIVLEQRSLPRALGGSFVITGHRFIESFTLALVPFILTVPTLLLDLRPQAIAYRLSPEFLIQVRIAGEILQLITNYLIIGAVTVCFLQHRDQGGTC